MEQIDLSFSDFTTICRICLSRKHLLGFQETLLNFYINMIRYTEVINAYKSNLPQNICENCHKQLENVFTFIDKCKINEDLLTNIYLSEHVKKSLSSEDSYQSEIIEDSSKHTKIFKTELEETPNRKLYQKSSKKLSPQKCNLCNEIFDGRTAFLSHNRLHKNNRDNKQFLCSYCGKNFIKNSHLERHIRIHTGVKPHKCKICGKSFGQSNDLKRHLLTHTREKVFHCDKCSKTFHQKSCLDNHKLTHTNLKNFECNYCEKKFTMKSYLEVHIRTHTGIKPYQCPHCDKHFYQKSGVSNHILVHTGEKPFKCVDCNKSFIQSNHLKEHLRIHSGEKPFICSYCGKAFAYRSTLKVHLRQHTGETPFVCSYCSKGFHDASNLRRHIKRHHTNEKN